ncbi:hypothetical protein [Roseibium sp.]|uniref:hypothetical protein n=1 Tax=Roseibium sp. TaxID=1936156 RepID=UPI003D0B24A2
MPSRFDDFLKSVVEFAVAAQAAEAGRKADKYIKAQVYIYTAQVEAAGHYKTAAHIQAARNAVFAGCVALCTMYVGGLIMGALFRGAAAGTAAAEGAAGAAVATEGAAAAEANALVQALRASWQASGLKASTVALTFAEKTAIEVCLGIPIRGLIGCLGAIVTEWHNGREHWSSVSKIPALAMGGVLRTGPALGFLIGSFGSQAENRQREEFERQIKTEAAKRLIETTLADYASTLGKSIKNCGRYGEMVLAPPLDIDSKVREPMQREVDRITDRFVREQSGFFGGPERDEVYASVYGSLGAEIWAPVASDTTRAFIFLQQELQRKAKAMDAAFVNWSRSF